MNPDDDRAAEIAARKQVAGRIGFGMGCMAALIAATINFLRAPRPLTLLVAATILLVAAINVPLGIAMGLLGERLSRRPVDDDR